MSSLDPHPFVGRTGELGDLAVCLDGVMAGRGGSVVVVGDAGIGKTRLCEEVASLAAERGIAVAWTACWEPGSLPALWPWRQLLGDFAADVSALEAQGDSPVEARMRFFDAVFDGLRARARAQPRLMILDDLQWADAATLRLLVYFSPLLRSLPAMVIATARDGVDAASVPSELRRQARVLHLGGLNVDELGDLAEAMTGSRPDRPATAVLHRVTGGNPLFAAEFIRRLHRDGQLRGLTDDDPIAVPPSVRAVLDDRLADVSDSCRRLLRVASLLGQEFSVSLLADVAGVDALDAARDLSEAAQDVVRAGAVDAYTFSHALIRNVLHDDLAVTERVRLHQRIGEALERRASLGADVDPSRLSFHYLHAASAGTAGKAAYYSELAARSALTTLAYEDAVALYDRALTANELDVAGSDRVSLLLGAGEARAASGDRDGARAAFLSAAELARRTERPAEVAAAALSLAGPGFEVALFDDTQVSLLEEGLAVVGDDRPDIRSRLSARLSVALSLAGDDERRVRLSEDAVRLADRAGDADAMAQALAARCDAHAGPAHLAGRGADAAKIVRIGQARGDHGTEMLGRRLRLVAALEAGDTAAADAEIHASAQLADRLGQPRYQWYVALWRATRAVMGGRLDEQRAYAEEAERLGRAAHSPHSEVLLPPHRWFSWLETGDVETALAELPMLMPPGSFSELGVQTVPIFSMHRLLAGRPDEARAMLDHATDDILAVDQDSEWLTVLGQISDVCFRLGGHPLTAWLYDALAPFADVWVMDGIGAYVHGPAHRYLGLLAALHGRPATATLHFEAAETEARRAGADLLVARALFDRGVALSDPEALHRARHAYRELGADRRVADVDNRLTGSPSSPEPPPHRSENSVFRRDGDAWTVRFEGRGVRVRDSKGMRDLAQLLARPGREIPAADLAGTVIGQGDLGDTIDANARAAYRSRLLELDIELDEADTAGDLERSALAQAERDALIDQLSSAYGLGGRPRRAGDPTERSRTAVTVRIRRAVRHIGELHPSLGRHLTRSVHTGTFCSYDPDREIRWQS